MAKRHNKRELKENSEDSDPLDALDGFMSNTKSQDKAEMYSPTKHEKYMIKAGELGLLDRQLGEVDVSKIPGYVVEPTIASLPRVRRFIYADQFVSIDVNGTLGAMGPKYASEGNLRAQAAAGLESEDSNKYVQNFLLKSDWADTYVTHGDREGKVVISGKGYSFVLPCPERMRQLSESDSAGDLEERLD